MPGHLMRRYDLAILGGGTAGLVAAVGAAGVGARVVLVERDRTGGDCLWRGCVPSKSLLAAAELAQRMRTADAVGLPPGEPEIDFSRVMERVRAAREQLAPHDSPERLRRQGVEVVHGEGRFRGPGELEVDGRVLPYRTALIATGSRPAVPPIDGLAEAKPLTSDTIWDLRELPRRLVVLGGGPVGCELAQALARLGSRTTIAELTGGLLPKEEPEARALVADRLREEGVDVRLSAYAERVEHGRLVLAGDGGKEHVELDRIVVAVGRLPVTEEIGLEAVGVETGESGAVTVDETLRTSAKGIFAAGDATGTLPFTHVAAHQGGAVVANALFHARRKLDMSSVPWVTFTDPEVGRAGLTEAQARERHGDRVGIERHDYAELDRAITAGVGYGFVKLVADRRGRLLGATVAAPAGGEAIASLVPRIARGERLGGIARTVHAYPTFAEGPARAAQEHLRRRFLSARTRRVARPLLGLLRLLERRQRATVFARGRPGRLNQVLRRQPTEE